MSFAEEPHQIKRRRHVMIAQNQQKVKKAITRVVQKAGRGLTVPERKFVLEMMTGMLATGQSNLTRIAAVLKEGIAVKNTLKRLQRMSSHERILEVANHMSMQAASGKVTDETVLALDDGDLTHQYGRAFECQSPVYDGSAKDTKSGYNLNQVSGYNQSSGETFPILFDMFSMKESGFLSKTNEALEMIKRVTVEVGRKGLWVADREYDNGRVLECFLQAALTFMVRMKETRDIWVKGRKHNIREVAEGVNRRVKFSSYARFGAVKCTLWLRGREYPATLVSYKDRRNKDIVMWVTSGWEKSTIELKRRIRGYFKRWGVEECYRFEKQGFGIEKATVRRYGSIKTLLGLSLLSWLALIRINENPGLKAEVQKAARMEKNKKKHQPKFVYYRLLQGVKNLFAGVKRMFLFRWKRRARKALLKTIPPMLPFLVNPTALAYDMEYGL
jgi:hypothetical protein